MLVADAVRLRFVGGEVQNVGLDVGEAWSVPFHTVGDQVDPTGLDSSAILTGLPVDDRVAELAAEPSQLGRAPAERNGRPTEGNGRPTERGFCTANHGFCMVSA